MSAETLAPKKTEKTPQEVAEQMDRIKAKLAERASATSKSGANQLPGDTVRSYSERTVGIIGKNSEIQIASPDVDGKTYITKDAGIGSVDGIKTRGTVSVGYTDKGEFSGLYSVHSDGNRLSEMTLSPEESAKAATKMLGETRGRISEKDIQQEKAAEDVESVLAAK